MNDLTYHRGVGGIGLAAPKIYLVLWGSQWNNNDPNGGWLDSSGEENGDKCAWISSGQGAAAN